MMKKRAAQVYLRRLAWRSKRTGLEPVKRGKTTVKNENHLGLQVLPSSSVLSGETQVPAKI
jgi:hypothetical protein